MDEERQEMGCEWRKENASEGECKQYSSELGSQDLPDRGRPVVYTYLVDELQRSQRFII